MGMGLGAKRLLGNEAEETAVAVLRREGYVILARNFSCRFGELDIVAERDRTVCFVEVRMRSCAAWGDPSQTVSYVKQRRVVKAAIHYLFRYDLKDRMIRFDVVSVVGRGERAVVEHLPNAFDAGR
jgi:putative endonuclease